MTDRTQVKAVLQVRVMVLQSEIQEKTRRVPTIDSSLVTEVVDDIEKSEVGTMEDIEFSLLQQKVDTLNRIYEALFRIEKGNYGLCFDCEDEISDRRLLALPFAVRCRDCEEKREKTKGQKRDSWGRIIDLFDHSGGVL